MITSPPKRRTRKKHVIFGRALIDIFQISALIWHRLIDIDDLAGARRNVLRFWAARSRVRFVFLIMCLCPLMGKTSLN